MFISCPFLQLERNPADVGASECLLIFKPMMCVHVERRRIQVGVILTIDLPWKCGGDDGLVGRKHIVRHLECQMVHLFSELAVAGH